MKATVKKYLVVSLTLGLIAGGSALLIGLTNVLTADRIKANKIEKENNGLKKVFSDENQTFTTVEFDTSFEYIEKIWTAKSSGEKDIGYIYKTSGKNSYGEVSLLLGFDTKKSFVNMVVLENTETYGTTLEDNYITPVNDKKIDFSSVSCGATYGAKLINNMYLEAKEDVNKR